MSNYSIDYRTPTRTGVDKHWYVDLDAGDHPDLYGRTCAECGLPRRNRHHYGKEELPR